MAHAVTGVVLAGFLFLSATADSAEALDRVVLKDGRVLEGKILTIRFVQVFIETPGGNEVIPMNRVERIERNVGGDAPREGAPGSPAATVPPEEKAVHDRLADAIRRQDVAAQAAAVRELAGAQARKSLQILALALTSDMELGVRTAAAGAMKRTPDPEGLFVEPLCRTLREGKDLALREACARALETSEYREMAIDTLVEILAGARPDEPRAQKFAAACREVLQRIAKQDLGAGERAAAKWQAWWKANRSRVREEDARRRSELTGAELTGAAPAVGAHDQRGGAAPPEARATKPGAAPAVKSREPSPEEKAAAEAAYLKLRRVIIRGVKDGQRLPLSVKRGGRAMRGWIVEADEESVALKNFGSGAEMSVPWGDIPPAKFMHLARQYTDDREALDAYARGTGLDSR